MTIDLLIKIYNKWGQDNEIKDLSCAEEMLCWGNLSEEQEQWLEQFVRVWDELQERKRIKQ